MKKIAAFDLGTNTFLCLIAEVSKDKRELRVIEDHCRIVRLGEKVHAEKKFSPQALERADQCLADFSTFVRKGGVDHIVATATSAARDVSNGSKLLEIGEKYSIPIKIIPGKKEAELSFAGALSGFSQSDKKNILVIDVGGGSTELIFRKAGEESVKAQSFNVGAVRLTEMFLKSDPVKEEEYEALINYADSELRPFGTIKPHLVIAVAGTPTTLACVAQKIEFEEKKVEGYILTQKKLSQLLSEIKNLKISDRKKMKGMVPERADVILAGAALLERSLKLTDKTNLCVSTRGLRFGTALHYEEFI